MPVLNANSFRKENTGRSNPSERFLSNTGGADVSIRTLGSHLSNRRNPRPHRQRISQATGIGNSVIIIDANAELREATFRWYLISSSTRDTKA